MEEGSLVQEALDTIKRSRGNGGCLQNKLVVDIFLFDQDPGTPSTPDRIQFFEALVSLCRSINESFERMTRAYPWFSGGDVPMFGVDVADGVAHLRAGCVYGPSVKDEWVMIGAVMEISKSIDNIMIKFWDLDDGQILLIESAMVLPRWVDEIGPAACEHRCWVTKGIVTLLRPNITCEPLSLKGAIRCLREGTLAQQLPSVQAVVEQRLVAINFTPTNEWNDAHHRTALVLPRTIAILLHKFPELLHCAVAAFERFGYDGPPLGKLDFENLVFTTHRIGRTSFALLRSLQTQIWDSDMHIPSVYKSVEVNRMKRTCQVESTPHLRHALQLGLRVTAGLDYILGQPSFNEDMSLSAEEIILRHWTGIDVGCGGNGEWLRDAWRAGPNESPVDLSSFISCPLEPVDLQEGFPFPRTYPRISLKSFVQQHLGKGTHDQLAFTLPSPADVDDEIWMHLDGNEQGLNDVLQPTFFADNSVVDPDPRQSKPEKPLDDMLDKFATFVEKESDAEGVVNEDSADLDYDEPLTIDPKLYLNLLYTVLTSTPEEIANLTMNEDADPFFGPEDYDLNGEDDHDVSAVMDAMDSELRIDSPSKGHVEDGAEDEQTSQDAQILSGLIQSLEASEAAAGPVRNILREMSERKRE